MLSRYAAEHGYTVQEVYIDEDYSGADRRRPAFNQMLAAFLRNDGAPGLATAAVLAGGVFNVFGDYFFVFTCDMGVFGAGLATAIGSGITFTVMLSHFFSRRCTLRPGWSPIRPTAASSTTV